MVCKEGHWNDGTDVCADCGADLNGEPAPAGPFIDRPRFRASGRRIPVAYIETTRDALGVPRGTVAEFYLNDEGSKAINPAREKLVSAFLAWLNEQAEASAS